MTIEKLRAAVVTRPFRPFTIVMGDGTRCHVSHPEMIAMNPKAERTVIVAFGAEEHAVLDLLLMTALEYGAPSRRKAG
jgi:hypothetical protein